MNEEAVVIRKIDTCNPKVEAAFAVLLSDLARLTSDVKGLQRELKQRIDLELKSVYIEMLSLTDFQQRNFDIENWDRSNQAGVDSVAMQRFILKYSGHLIEAARFDVLFKVKFKQQNKRELLNLKSFLKLFTTKQTVMSTVGHGIARPSLWNRIRGRATKNVRFRPGTRSLESRLDERLSLSQTKSF